MSSARIALWALFYLLLLNGCAPTESTNLLILVSDTLRADALACYGGEASTPNLCALADRGVLFENAFANAPWTLPSSVAMMTGSHPGQYRRQNVKPVSIKSFYYVPESEQLLAEELLERGYDIECRLENGLASRTNAMQGFVKREPYGRQRNLRILAQLEDRLEHDVDIRDDRYLSALWLVESLLDPQQAEFVFLHWFDDPHAEYRPPKTLRETLRDEIATLPRPLEYYLGLGHHHRPRKGLRKLRGQAGSLSSEEIAFIRRLYLLEVESVDERIGQVLSALEVSGKAESTIVVFTSDHGEAFGEHGKFLHGNSLYSELVHVPWIMAGPGIATGHRVETAVSLVDLMPTLAELVGARLRGIQGRSLVPALKGHRLDRRPVYLESPDRLDKDGLVFGDLKILAATSADHVEFFDLASDPDELHDLSSERPEEVAQMRDILTRVRDTNELQRTARTTAADPEALAQASEETLEQMRALGYLD